MATEIGTETNHLTDSLLGWQLVEDACSFAAAESQFETRGRVFQS